MEFEQTAIFRDPWLTTLRKMFAEEKETEQKEEEMRGTVVCLRRRNKLLKIDRKDQYTFEIETDHCNKG